MKADLSPGLQRKAFMAENMVTIPLKHKECFKQMPSKPRIPITADGKKNAGIRHWINEESIAEAFQNELSSFPSPLFHNGHMRVAAMRNFLNYLCNPWGDSSIVEDRTLTEPHPVTACDAGMFLQNLIILWKQGITLGSIKDQNISHLIRLIRQPQEIIVTFDDYLGLQGHVQR